MTLERKSSLFILLACLFWGLDILVRYPLTLKMGFVHIVFIESVLGLVVVLPWFFTRGRKALSKLRWPDWLLAMFIGGFGTTLAGLIMTEGILEASPGTFSFMQIFQPLFVVYAARVFLKERIDGLYFYWGPWAIMSAILMFSQDLEILLSSDMSTGTWPLLVPLGTVIIWSFCTIAGKKFLASHGPMTLVSLRWGFAFLFTLPFLALDEVGLRPGALLEWETGLRFGFMALAAGSFSMYFYYKGMSALPAGKIAFLELSYPALGIIFSALYTFEHVGPLQALGLGSFFALIFFMMGKK